jgi:hypothetical protein
MLAKAEDVEADLIGQFDLLKQIADALDRTDPGARRRVGHIVAEGVDAEFHFDPLQGASRQCSQDRPVPGRYDDP